MKFEKTWTGNWENAFRGLRHPFESYAKSDSAFGIAESDAWFEDEVETVAQSYINNWSDERIDEFLNLIYEWAGCKNMQLLYRGTKDGMTSKHFHEICDNQGKTITIFSIQKF